MKAFVLLLGLTSLPIAAQEVRLVEGNVYSCTIDGTHVYNSEPLEGYECRPIKYSFFEQDGPGPGWVPMAHGEKVRVYYRENDLTRQGDMVSFWALDDYEEAQYQAGFGRYHSMIGRWSVDCSNKTYYSVQSTRYSERYGKGMPLDTWAMRSEPKPLYATPGSIGEIMVNAACAITSTKQHSGAR